MLARAEHGYKLSTPEPGWAEQDPEDWWRAAQAALADLGLEPASIGLSGQMHGLVVLDENDRVLRPAILWNDQRTARECAEIEDRIGLERLIELTGNRALTGFTAPKLLWLRNHEPELYARVRHVLLPKDYVRFRLTGEHAIDVADASGTLLFDVGRRCWSDEVLEALELPREWLPPAHESTAIGGAGDQAAGALGVGIDRPGPVSVVLGTSGVVFAALPEYRPEPEARLHAFCHAVPGMWHAMGVMLSAAGSLSWLHGALGGPSYEELFAEAERWEPGVEGLLFQPYLQGERTPHADPDARGAFVGLSLRHDRGALVRAVLEGVAYGLRDSLELLREMGVEADLGRVSGGGARSELWLKIVASVLGLPLERTIVEEGAAYGAALLGGVKEGVFADAHEAVASCVRVRDRVEPDPAWQAAYEEGYARYRDLYPALCSPTSRAPTLVTRPALAGSPEFVPGLELARGFYVDVVAPLVADVRHSAALLGSGSDVLGFDTPRSTDHGWGPRLQLFVESADAAALDARLEDDLPEEYCGWPVRFGWDDHPVTKRVEVIELGRWLQERLGFDPHAGLSYRDWLATPQQLLLEVTAGSVFHDGLGSLEPLRESLRWYPDEVWLWLIAAQWRRIDQEEPFVGRTAEVDDDLGSRVLTARLVRDLMRLAFLLERHYAPYGKWLGTAFRRLDAFGAVGPALAAALAASSYGTREAALVDAVEELARRHNALGLTEEVDPSVRLFHSRPFRVLGSGRFVDACLARITDPWLRSLPLVGAIDQFVDTTDVLSKPLVAPRAARIYDD